MTKKDALIIKYKRIIIMLGLVEILVLIFISQFVVNKANKFCLFNIILFLNYKR